MGVSVLLKGCSAVLTVSRQQKSDKIPLAANYKYLEILNHTDL